MVCLGCGSGGRTGLEPPSSAVEDDEKAGLPRIGGSSTSGMVIALAEACAGGEDGVGDEMVTVKVQQSVRG